MRVRGKILTAIGIVVAALSIGFNINKSNQKQISANITYHNPFTRLFQHCI